MLRAFIPQISFILLKMCVLGRGLGEKICLKLKMFICFFVLKIAVIKNSRNLVAKHYYSKQS